MSARWRWLAVLSSSAGGILMTAPAAAQPAPDPVGEARLDPAVPTGIVWAGLGSAALVTGAVLYGTNEAPNVYRSGVTQRNWGVGLLGLGAGFVAAGVPAILGGLLAPQEHMSPSRMVVGIMLMGLGAAGLGMSGALFTTPDTIPFDGGVVEHAKAEDGMALGAGLGGISLALGLPLLTSGAPRPQTPPEIRDPTMAYAGYAMYGAGGVLAIIATVALGRAYGKECGSGCGQELALVVSGLHGATILNLTGLGLVASGHQRVGSF
jgi:hypothetical protein